MLDSRPRAVAATFDRCAVERGRDQVGEAQIQSPIPVNHGLEAGIDWLGALKG